MLNRLFLFLIFVLISYASIQQSKLNYCYFDGEDFICPEGDPFNPCGQPDGPICE